MYYFCQISKISERWSFKLYDIKFMNPSPFIMQYKIIDVCCRVFVSEFKEASSSSQSMPFNYEASPRGVRVLKS